MSTDSSKMEIELASLKEKVSFFNVIYEKFDTTLGKIQEMIENRRYENNEEIKDAHSKIEASEQRILAEIKNIREEMKVQHTLLQDKINDIDRWRWLLIGGAAVVGFLINLIFNK